MNKFDGVIFDIDGTLTSSNQLIFDSFNHILGRYMDKQLTPPEIIALFGPTEDDLIEGWFPDTHLQVKKDYYDYYEENHHLVSLFPGIEELLGELKTKGIKLGVFTGKGRTAALITLKKLDIYKYFDQIVTGTDVINHKPSPEGILLFLQNYNIKPERAVMIGDAIADIKAARGAGIKVVSVLWDSYAKDEILKLGSDHIVHTVKELRDFLLN